MRTEAFSRSPMLSSAMSFAAQVHAGQLRKYVRRPYIEHPLAVARLVARFRHDEDMLAAALLHDTVEDTPAEPADIQRLFGASVAQLVADLTDVSRPSDGSRAVRKEMDRRHLAGASPRAKTIKLMDLVHNTGSIVRHDRGFARVYLAEKARLLEVLSDASDPAAFAFAVKVHERAMRRLFISE